MIATSIVTIIVVLIAGGAISDRLTSAAGLLIATIAIMRAGRNTKPYYTPFELVVDNPHDLPRGTLRRIQWAAVAAGVLWVVAAVGIVWGALGAVWWVADLISMLGIPISALVALALRRYLRRRRGLAD